MKKLFTLLLSCMVVFGLSACTNNNKDTGQSNPTKQTDTPTQTEQSIDEAFREQIFEPFFRIDKSRSRELGGVGLGLAMVREVVRVHDGTIEVYTNKHSGTTFEVRMGME